MTPLEAFDIILWRAYFLTRRGGPGALVLSASQEVREALSGLRSDDIANIRVDAIFGSVQ